MDVFDRLMALDKALLIKINSEWNTPQLDWVFRTIRETYFWIPLYLFFVVLVLLHFGKKGWLWILAGVLTIAITDQVSSNLIKEFVSRLRPCRDPSVADQIRFFIRYCPGSSSFTSSHATNHFGFACFVIFTLRQYLGQWIYVLLFLAATVAYAQVYVGVHYPTDVLCGAIIGSCIGTGMSLIFNKKIGLPQLAD